MKVIVVTVHTGGRFNVCLAVFFELFLVPFDNVRAELAACRFCDAKVGIQGGSPQAGSKFLNLLIRVTTVGGLCRVGWCLLVPTFQILFIAHFDAPLFLGKSCVNNCLDISLSFPCPGHDEIAGELGQRGRS